MTDKKLTFEATPATGSVDALLTEADSPLATLVLGHGAGANMQHVHMEAIAASLARARVSTLRFNFPFMQAGRRRTDNLAVCLETIAHAIHVAADQTAMPIFLGGHSFGGRMASHFAAASASDAKGLVYYSFPLHPVRKPDTRRGDHLGLIRLPQLFLSGTRDALADLKLLRPLVHSLPRAGLHELDSADHGFKVAKRSRQVTEDVYDEAARAASQFINAALARERR